MSKSHLTEEDRKEMFPDFSDKEWEELKNTVLVFRELFFECIRKKMGYNVDDDSE